MIARLNAKEPVGPVLPSVDRSDDRSTKVARESMRAGFCRLANRSRAFGTGLTGCLAISLLTAFARLLQAQPAEPAARPEFYEDFRNSRAPSDALKWSGLTDAGEVSIAPEPAGLRLTLAANRPRKDAVGSALTSAVTGDFEITAGYELLDSPRPKSGRGVGFELYLTTVSDTREALAVLRVQRPDGGEGIVCSRGTTINGQRRFRSEEYPAADKGGRLRVTRAGAEATVWIAEGAAGDFRSLAQYTLGPEDLNMVRVGAYPGNAGEAVSVRLVDLRVRADRLEVAQPETPASAPADLGRQLGSRTWVAVAELVGLALILAVAAWAYVRHNRRARARPAEAPVPDDRAGPEADSRGVSFPCPGCDKPLKARAQQTGRKLKCPQCGQAVVVPGAAAAPSRLPPLGAALLVTAGLGWLAHQPASAASTPATSTEYTQSFRGPPVNATGLKFTGPGARQCVRYRPDGLRITLPSGWKGERPGTGLTIARRVRGDFEITLRYELLTEPDRTCAGEFGTRLSLGILLDKHRADFALLARAVGVRTGKTFVAWLSSGNNTAERAEQITRHFPTTARAGQLRLVRKGAVLSYQVADEGCTTFSSLQEHPFGTEDLIEVRIVGQTSGAAAILDARVYDLHIQAESLAGAPRSPVTRDWLGRLAVGMVVGGLLLAALLGRFGSRHAAVLVRGSPLMHALDVAPRQARAFQYVDCGTQLPCPRCSDAVFVSATTAGGAS